MGVLFVFSFFTYLFFFFSGFRLLSGFRFSIKARRKQVARDNVPQGDRALPSIHEASVPMQGGKEEKKGPQDLLSKAIVWQ